MRAIVVERHGGPEVLTLAERETPEPGPGQVRVELRAGGVNFLDVYQRTGANPMELPFVGGNEGAGTVTAVGEDVDDVAVGERVAWAMVPGTGYAEQVLVPAERVVPIPDGVDEMTAAAVMLQGMTAHYLVNSAYPVREGQTVLVTGAAGGTGLLLCQLLRAKGARVLGTVSTPEKAALARKAGATDPILYRDVDLAGEVRRLTDGEGVHVVYDGVGRDTFDALLTVLRRRGTMVLFGAASGPVPPVDPMRLMKGGSLFLTRASLVDYIADRSELLQRAAAVLGSVAEGTLTVRIGGTYPLHEARRAHEHLESGTSTGKLLLLP